MLLLSGSKRIRLDDVLGTRGFDDDEEVSLSSLKMMPWSCLANDFSSEVSSWFIDDSSEGSSSSNGKSKESSSLPSSSESHNHFLTIEDSTSSSNVRLPLLSLDAILRRREIEMESVIGWMRENVGVS
jgi:hypothetical protein